MSGTSVTPTGSVVGGLRSGPDRWSRVDTAWLAAIALTGLTLRLVVAFQYSGHPLGRLPWVDEGAYWTRAGEILAGHWLPARPFYQDPLFPYALASVMAVVGSEVASLRVILACLGSATPVVVFLAGRRGLGRAEAIVAGWIVAAYGPMVFADGLLEKEGLAALVASLALLASAGASTSVSSWRVAAFGLAGGLWGVLGLLRANALLIGPLGAAWAGWSIPKRRLASTLAFAGGFATAILPATAINAWVGRTPELILTTNQTGANFFIGNGPGATGTYRAPDFVEANPAREGEDFEAEAWRRSGRPLTPAQVSRFWLGEGLARWRESPGDSVRLLVKKVGLLLHDFEVPDNQDIEFTRIVAAPGLAWAFLGFGWLAPFAALGLTRRDRSRFWWFLMSATTLGFLSTAVFFVVGRYRIPWTPGLALLAGAGMVELGRRFGSRQWAEVGWRVALVAVPIAVLAWRPIPDPAPDRWGHALIMLAMAELAESRLEPAIDALDEARALGEGPAARAGEITASGPVHDRLALLVAYRLRSGGDPPRLDRARWLRQFPESRAEARTLLDSAIKDEPADRRALRESAAWWLGESADSNSRRMAANQLELADKDPGGDPESGLLFGLMEQQADRFPRPDPALDRGLGLRIALARAIVGVGRRKKSTG